MESPNTIAIYLLDASLVGDGSCSRKAELNRIVSGALVFVVSGSVNITVNLRDYSISTHDIVTVVQGNSIRMSTPSENFKAYYVVFSADFIRDADLFKRMMDSFAVMTEHPVLPVEKHGNISMISGYCAMMYEIYSKQDVTFRSEIVKNMLEAVLFAVNGLYRDCFPLKAGISAPPPKKLTRNDEVLMRFMSLVSENYGKERTVSFYADALCITPKHLAHVVKSASGELPSDVVSQAVVMDAKSKLKSTDMPVSQIADSLNFPNASFFCKYFRKHTGMTPRAYRNSVR